MTVLRHVVSIGLMLGVLAGGPALADIVGRGGIGAASGMATFPTNNHSLTPMSVPVPESASFLLLVTAAAGTLVSLRRRLGKEEGAWGRDSGLQQVELTE